MYGNVVNRIAERGTPVEPVVGDIATSYLWSDRKIHYITEVIKNGKEFFTIDIKRIRKDLDAKISFKTDENGKKLITVIDNNGIVYVEDGIYLEKFSKDRHYLYITKNDLESPNERKDKWKLLKDNRFHKSYYDQFTGKYSTTRKNTVIAPGVNDYYFDLSF